MLTTHSHRAISESVRAPLPYDDILYLRDRMWDISPTLVRYDVTESTSTAIAALGISQLASLKTTAASHTPIGNPISNFYQTDPISRA